MASLNKCILIGNLGRDPELRYTANGQAVTEFSMAMSERFTSNGQQQERTEWANIVVWGGQAEACAQYLAKGRQVYVEGRLQTRNYEKDGIKHFRTEVVASHVVFLGSVGGGVSAHGGSDDDDADSIPF